MTLWRDGKVTGGRGEGSATGARAPTAKPKASATPPASPATNKASGSVIRPTASAEFVEKASAARKAWNVAIAELEEASGAYARALHQAGDDAQVDAAIRERNEAAEADVARAGKQIQTVVDEARRSGVSDDVMRLYIQMTTGTR
jgi:hypothetical protein